MNSFFENLLLSPFHPISETTETLKEFTEECVSQNKEHCWEVCSFGYAENLEENCWQSFNRYACSVCMKKAIGHTHRQLYYVPAGMT